MENENNKLFEFKYWSRYHFIALAVPIFCMLTTYLQKEELALYKQNDNPKIKAFPYFFNIFISKLLSIIFVLLKKLINKRNNNKVETKNMRRYHLGVNNKVKKIKAAFLIISISILELIFKIEGYNIIGQKNYIELKLGFLLIVPILSIFILKKQLFKHHYFAFSISFIAFILVCLSSHFYSKRREAKEQVRHLFYSIPLGLAFVLIKYLYEFSFVDAFSFLFYDGILCIIIPFISIGLISIFEGSDYFIDNMKGVKYLFAEKEIIILFIFVVICSFGYYLSNALTIYIFNPSLMVMTDILSPIFRWVIEVFRDNEKTENNFIWIAILKGIGFIFIIFSSVVFNEILILHFCGFDKNIEGNLMIRANREISIENEDLSISMSREDEEDISVDKTNQYELSNIN
jgi:hypothetical protein